MIKNVENRKISMNHRREEVQMITVKTYRGHIRNWKELCAELEIDPALPREEKEQEILVKAYQKWGGEMADHIYGMFAFALWDEEEKKLFCLRDQFGTKPFYYYQTEDGELLYGTMIRDIIGQPGFKKELNEEMLQIYMSLTYGAGEDTFFKGLKKLLPGRYLIWKDGKVEIHRYWTPKFQHFIYMLYFCRIIRYIVLVFSFVYKKVCHNPKITSKSTDLLFTQPGDFEYFYLIITHKFI